MNKKIRYESMVLDDRKEVIETLANARPDLKLFRINRIDEEKLKASQIRTIKSLSELLAF